MTNNLTLNIHDEDDLVLPFDLISSELPANELIILIGFLAFQDGHYDFANKLFLTDESGDVSRALKERGILSASLVGNVAKIRVDLTKLLE